MHIQFVGRITGVLTRAIDHSKPGIGESTAERRNSHVRTHEDMRDAKQYFNEAEARYDLPEL
jgi:hypothetical protein